MILPIPDPDPSTIVILRPMKMRDATEYTYKWGEKAVRLAKSLGYNVIDIRKNVVTYDNVTNVIEKYKPRLLVSFSHGCPTSIQGQDECVITEKIGIDELVRMENFRDIVEPLRTSCPGICEIESNPCENICFKDTNINKLKGSIVYAVACHSAVQLGKSAIQYGIETYIAYDDLLLFPVDSLNSQDIFGDIHIEMLNGLLMGQNVRKSVDYMIRLEDAYIRYYKGIKYMALTMLWNKMHFKVLGNSNATIY